MNNISCHAFLWSNDSAPRPPPSLVVRQQVVYLSQSSCVSPIELIDVGGGTKSCDHDKAWPSIFATPMTSQLKHP
jgi:hypothetical protein